MLLGQQASDMTKRLTAHLWSLIGAVVTLAGLLALLTSASLKSWVKDQSYLIFILLVLSIASAFVVVDFVLSKKRGEGSAHDREVAGEVLHSLPPNGNLIIWLKETFISKSIPIKYLDTLDNLADQMRFNVVGMDNPQANRAYLRLRDSITEFHSLVCFNTFASHDYKAMENSPDWPWEQWQEASKQISQARTEVIEAYNEFLRICHKNQIV